LDLGLLGGDHRLAAGLSVDDAALGLLADDVDLRLERGELGVAGVEPLLLGGLRLAPASAISASLRIWAERWRPIASR
jgi:hypothetical protein